ncbi:hypothetical protein HQ619_05290 [Burkholderia gladioli]|nr:DUF6726 family protein [Burkholderia gladioli]MBA1363076.1 hypothetical protein [Burkholderia gladioli]MBU9643888.1 hypothetical protein [Burkholderia gladioli]MDN7718537.1 hypothetical protein [Burkholderia gladioli]NRF83339.1 hypothetical protein [Burkholderia gladioli]
MEQADEGKHRGAAWRAWHTRATGWIGCGALCLALGGCGLAAAPCRVASAGLTAVPLVGHVAALPTDACAGVVDP